MASGHITSWQIDGEKMETLTDFIFLSSNITEGDCSLLLRRKAMTKQDMEQWTDSKLGKEYVKTVYFHPAYLSYMQSTS